MSQALRETFDLELKREDLISFISQLRALGLSTTSTYLSNSNSSLNFSVNPLSLSSSSNPEITVPIPQHFSPSNPPDISSLHQEMPTFGSGSPQATQLRAHIQLLPSSNAAQMGTSSSLNQDLSPPGSPKRSPATISSEQQILTSSSSFSSSASTAISQERPPSVSSPSHQSQPFSSFMIPTTPMLPDMFKGGRIGLTESFITETVDSKDPIQRIIWSAQFPGLERDDNLSGWMISVAQHSMHLWKCSLTNDDSQISPVELRHTSVVDEKLLSADIAENSKFLIAGTASGSGSKNSVTGITLYSIAGESFLESRGRILTQLEPNHVLSLDQLRGAVSNSVCCSQKTHIFIYDLRGTVGTPKAQWKAHESDVTYLRRNTSLGCVASGAWRGDCSFWDLRKPPNKPSSVFAKHQRAVTGIELAGQSFMMTSSSDGYLNVWDVRRPQNPLHTTTPDRSPVISIRNLANTYTFAVSTTKGLYVFDGQTNSISRVNTSQQAPTFASLQWDLNIGTLYASSQNSISCFKILQRKS